jgi:hypothetical protein
VLLWHAGEASLWKITMAVPPPRNTGPNNVRAGYAGDEALDRPDAQDVAAFNEEADRQTSNAATGGQTRLRFAQNALQPQSGDGQADASDAPTAGAASMPARFPTAALRARALDRVVVSAASHPPANPPLTVVNDETMKLNDIIARESAELARPGDGQAVTRAIGRRSAATAARYAIQAQADRADRDKAAAAWFALRVNVDEHGEPKEPVTDPQVRAVYLSWKAAEAKVGADEAMIDKSMAQLERFALDPDKYGNAASEAIGYINSKLTGLAVADDLTHQGRGFPLSLANSAAALENRQSADRTSGSRIQAWRTADAELAKATEEPPLTFVSEASNRLGAIIAAQSATWKGWLPPGRQAELGAKAKIWAATAARYSIQMQADRATRNEAAEAAKVLGVELDKSKTPDFSDPQERVTYLKWKDAQARVDADQAMIDRSMAELQALADGQRSGLWTKDIDRAAATGAIDSINTTLLQAGVTDDRGRPLLLSLTNMEEVRRDLQSAAGTADARIQAWHSANAELASAQAAPERSVLGIGEVPRAFANLGNLRVNDFPAKGEGPKIESWNQRDYLRVKKAGAGSIQTLERINDRYPGSPKITVELAIEGEGALRDWAVETNITDTAKSFPWDPPGTIRPTVFGETIWNGPTLGYEGRYEYTLSRDEYDDFVKNYLGRENGKIDNVNGLVLAAAFKSYLKVNPHDAIGYDHTVSTRVSAKEYLSMTGADFAGQLRPAFARLGIPVPGNLGAMAEDAIRMAPMALGAYAEAGVSLKLALTLQHYDAATFDIGAARVDDINPGARNALVLKFMADGQSFGTLSAGGRSVAGFGGEAGVLGGVAWVLDGSLRPVQTTYMGEFTANKFTTEGRTAIDIRPNVQTPPVPGGQRQYTGAQATYVSFPLEGGAGTFEIRVNQYKNGQPRSDRDVLLEQFASLAESGDTAFRLGVLRGREDYAPLFLQQWENEARQAYVNRVRGGAPLSDGQWTEILGTHLSGKYPQVTNTFVYSLGPIHVSRGDESDSAAKWAHDYISPKQKEAYANWPRIGKEFLENKAKELDGLDAKVQAGQLSRADYDKIYKYYYNTGLRIPGVYFGVYKTDGEFTTTGVGVSVGGDVIAAKNGLIQARDTRKTTHMDQVASIGVRPEAWPEFNRYLHTPGVREAMLQYYNRYGQPRESAVDPQAGRNARGELVDDSILSFLMYDGITPTRERRQLEEATHIYRDLAKEKHIYTVQAGDRNFADIGRQALAHVTGRDPRGISNEEAGKYWEQVRYFNFKRGTPRFGTFTPGFGEANPEVFQGAHLLLPPLPDR